MYVCIHVCICHGLRVTAVDIHVCIYAVLAGPAALLLSAWISMGGHQVCMYAYMYASSCMYVCIHGMYICIHDMYVSYAVLAGPAALLLSAWISMGGHQVCMYAYMYTSSCMYGCIHVCISVFIMYICTMFIIRRYTHTHTHKAWMSMVGHQVCMYVCMYAYMYICTYVYISMHGCICARYSKCVYTHTSKA
jgi:hypothetical protein